MGLHPRSLFLHGCWHSRFFFFLSLALAKRFSELFNLRLHDQLQAQGRSYVATDSTQIAIFGTTSGYLSVLVLALYINSEESLALYPQPAFLWLLCPLLLYWISRLWLIAHRGQLNEDPVVFTVTDRTTYLIASLIIIVFVAASSTWPPF